MRGRWFLRGVAHLVQTVVVAMLVATVTYIALVVALLSVPLSALR